MNPDLDRTLTALNRTAKQAAADYQVLGWPAHAREVEGLLDRVLGEAAILADDPGDDARLARLHRAESRLDDLLAAVGLLNEPAG